MRDIAFFARRSDYVEYLWHERLRDPLVQSSPFYQRLVDWVVDHRAPLFYEISDRDEHFAFSGAYHFESARTYDGDLTRQTIFFLHDFTHLLFPYPHDMSAVSLEQFTRVFTHQERIASSETELLAYYRVPGLRERVFPDELLLYDVMIERGEPQPSPALFLLHRDRIIMDDDYGDSVLGDHPEILSWMRSWRRLTPAWCAKRWASMQGRAIPELGWKRLHVGNYEQVIANYRSPASQDDYEQNILRNLTLAWALLGWEDPPTRFAQAAAAVSRLEGEVLVR